MLKENRKINYTNPSNFTKKGYSKLDFEFPIKLGSDIFKNLDQICNLVDTDFESSFQSIENVINAFCCKSKNTFSNEIRFKNIKEMNIHQGRCQTYLSGLYEYIVEQFGTSPKNSDALNSIQLMKTCMDSMMKKLEYFISEINKKVEYLPVLRAWKFTQKNETTELLPLHYDRTLFTIILHTVNPSTECLRILPNGNNMSIAEVMAKMDSSQLIQPSADEFPLIFPGALSKLYFGINPTPHLVFPIDKRYMNQNRYSLILKIYPKD